MIRIISFLFYLSFLAGTSAQAQYLSEPALFQRCYLQITGTRAKAKDTLTLDVIAGRKKAVDACLEVLQRAQFVANSNQTISNSSDTVAKNVLTTFHHLHSSWFYSKDFPVISWPGHTMDLMDLYDSTTPALYYTRALFKPNTPVSDVVTSNDNLAPIRTNMDPAAGPSTGHPKSDFVFTSPFVFAPTGDLLGVQTAVDRTVTFDAANAYLADTNSFNLSKTQGGGLLGTEAYLLLNLSNISSYSKYKTDGALKTHRRWGKAVFRDLLCRELPVVRESDVTALVSASSSIPFRTSAACTKCHASHDRVAGVLRGLKVFYVGVGDPKSIGDGQRGGNFADFYPVAKSAETTWSLSPDPDYYQRPSNGVFFFRDYLGNLLNQNVTGISDLGQKISSTDDFYICAAKRYYSYFTGIQVDTGDITDPDHTPALGPEDLKHRDIVITLGKHLRQSQSLQQLIGEILRLDHYRKLDFGTRSGVNVQ